MAGHPFRISKTSEPENPFTAMQAPRLVDLRRFLLRLSIDTHSSDEILSKVRHAVQGALGCPCSFIYGNLLPEAAPGHSAVPVTADGSVVGTLVVKNCEHLLMGINRDELQEIADLIGLAVMTAHQTEAMAELQSDSEDMLFHAPDAIFVASADGVIQMANRRVLELVNLDFNKIIGHPVSEVFASTTVSRESLAYCARNAEVLEVELSSSAGRRLVSFTPSFVSDEKHGKLLCILRDITAEHQSHLAIRRTERALSMGQAVEYLLHEVNNPLSALLANLSQAGKKLEDVHRIIDTSLQQAQPAPSSVPAPELGEKVKKIKGVVSNAARSSARIRDTMSVLRAAHAGGNRPIKTIVDPAYEIALALSGLEQEIQDASVVIQRESFIQGKIHTVPLVVAEGVGALVRNAIEALENRQDGLIRIIAEETETSLRISVKDNGPGVPKHLEHQIFMPFFTTKPLGRSLGLGLTMLDDSLRRLGGAIKVVPCKETGACFEISIPK